MKQISLTQGKFALVDDADYEVLSKFKWQYNARGNGYAKRTVRIGKKFRTIHMHRLIAGAKVGEEVDHKNGNGLDNQRENLRIANRFENAQNRGIFKNNKSGYKGVVVNENTGQITATIKVNKERIYLGTFQSVEDASEAYKNALHYHGEFANGNT